MDTMEIILLIAGGIIFTLSFILPVKKEEVSEGTKELVKEEIRELVEEEIGEIKGKVSDIVEETVTYSMEKTERSLERLSNEKIMAVNEYSDTVLEEINKNHTEVMFLYDMLNDKHQNLKAVVSEVEKAVKEAEQAVEPILLEKAEAAEDTQKPETQKNGKHAMHTAAQNAIPVPDTKAEKKKGEDADFKTLASPKPVKKASELSAPDISFRAGVQGEGVNNNDRILELHNAGKSNVAIAKELGLGIGEVKLVIDLFEGM